METLETKKVPKSSGLFYCNFCHYSTSRESQYMRHISTDKHIRKLNGTILVPKSSALYTCDCGKIYSSKSGLWKHNKKCNKLSNISINDSNEINILSKNDVNIDKDFIMSVMKQNNELQMQLVELLKNGTHNTSFTNNSHNKTFNLQFFLNETCKDAMNLTDFVNSLQLQLCDLEKMGDIGYVNGMSNIILKSLKDMDVTERPVHCTDKKRETLYVKDEGIWDKETEQKPKLRKAIKHIARKNALLLNEFKENHPDCMKSDSAYSDTYDKLIIEAMGGKDYDESQHENKIIKNISQEIIVEK